tara:strand:+ start:2929 stop:3123 length:195 start_codon:yes stop_codon:yes gene_type:complete
MTLEKITNRHASEQAKAESEIIEQITGRGMTTGRLRLILSKYYAMGFAHGAEIAHEKRNNNDNE